MANNIPIGSTQKGVIFTSSGIEKYLALVSAEDIKQAIESLIATVHQNIASSAVVVVSSDTRPICRFDSLGTAPIRCAVNPLAESCEGCRDFEAGEGEKRD